MANVSIFVRAFDKATRVFKKVNMAGTRMATSLTKTFGGIRGALAGVGLALGAGALLKSLVGANAQFQKLQARLETFTGSAASARATFDQLAEFAATTPFELQDSVEAFITLRSAGIEPTEESMRRFGDTASAFGASIKDVAESVRSATTGEMERLKRFGIVARLQGDTITASFKGQTTVLKRNAKEVSNFIETLAKQEFAGAMEREMATIGGALSQVSDAWFQLLTQVGEGGFSTEIFKLLTGLSNFITKLKESQGQVTKWTKVTILAVKAIGTTLLGLGTIAWKVVNSIGRLFLIEFESMKLAFFTVMNVIVREVNNTVETINKIPGVEIEWRMDNFNQGVQTSKEAIRDHGRAMAEMANDTVVDLQGIGEAWIELGATAVASAETFERAAASAQAGLAESGLAGGAEGSTGTGGKNEAAAQAKALQNRVDLMVAATEVESTRAEGLAGLFALEQELATTLAATNITTAERNALEAELLRIQTQRASVVAQEAELAKFIREGTLNQEGRLAVETRLAEVRQALATSIRLEEQFTARLEAGGLATEERVKLEFRLGQLRTNRGGILEEERDLERQLAVTNLEEAERVRLQTVLDGLRAGLPDLAAEEERIAAALASSTLSLGAKVLLEQQLDQIRAARAGEGAEVVGTPGEGEEAEGELTGVPKFISDLLEGTLGLKGEMESLDQAIDFIAGTTLAKFGASWLQAFGKAGEGARGLAKAVVGSSKKAIGQVAGAKAKETAIGAAESLAKGLTNPIHLIQAAKLFAVSAAYASFASLMGGSGGGAGGAGGGGAGGGAGVQASAADAAQGRGEAVLIIEGGLLNLDDPVQAQRFEDAINRLTDQGRVTIRSG